MNKAQKRGMNARSPRPCIGLYNLKIKTHKLKLKEQIKDQNVSFRKRTFCNSLIAIGLRTRGEFDDYVQDLVLVWILRNCEKMVRKFLLFEIRERNRCETGLGS